MNGELAQLIALAAHGSAYLAGGLDAPPELLHANSTFQYVGSVEFHPGRKRAIAGGTAGWFESLREHEAGSIAVLLPAESDPSLSGFAGGLHWRLRVSGMSGADDWIPSWDVGTSHVPDASWRVVYRRSRAVGEATKKIPGQIEARAQLVAALDDAEDFARRQNMGFSDWFREARQLLNSTHPKPPYHPDMLPTVGYTLEARQLLAAGTRAWVFGGMGSWNDLYFEDEAASEYQRVTNALWAAVLDALAVSANAFGGSQLGSSGA